MFRGEYSLSLDPKGRLGVPARYRERLTELCGGKLVVTISLQEKCLVAYPYPDWQRIEDQLGRLPAFDTKAQTMNHLLIGHANECEMDGHGRILIPQSLRGFAKLDRHVKMVGQVGKFELWDEAEWVTRRQQMLEQIGQLLEEPSDALRALVL